MGGASSGIAIRARARSLHGATRRRSARGHVVRRRVRRAMPALQGRGAPPRVRRLAVLLPERVGQLRAHLPRVRVRRRVRPRTKRAGSGDRRPVQEPGGSHSPSPSLPRQRAGVLPRRPGSPDESALRKRNWARDGGLSRHRRERCLDDGPRAAQWHQERHPVPAARGRRKAAQRVLHAPQGPTAAGRASRRRADAAARIQHRARRQDKRLRHRARRGAVLRARRR